MATTKSPVLEAKEHLTSVLEKNKKRREEVDAEVTAEQKEAEDRLASVRSQCLHRLMAPVGFKFTYTPERRDKWGGYTSDQPHVFTYTHEGQSGVIRFGYTVSINGCNCSHTSELKRIIDAASIFPGGIAGVMEFVQKAHDILY